MTRSIARWLTPVLGMSLLVAACDDGDVTGPSDDAPRVSVFLTDAPGGVEAVWVEIVDLVLEGQTADVDLLDTSTGLVELTELVGVAAELVDDLEVPPDTYKLIRLRLGQVVLESDDGEVYVMGGGEHPDGLEATGDLMCPSCDGQGIRVRFPRSGLTVDGESAIVLDFDVTQSFGHRAGKSGKWMLRPVINAAIVLDADGDGDADDDAQDAPSIEGSVVLAQDVTLPECPAGTPMTLEDIVPTATASTLVDDEGAAVIRSGQTDAEGEFQIHFLEADTYTLGVASLDLTDWLFEVTATAAPATVDITDADVDGVVLTVTGATCTAVSP